MTGIKTIWLITKHNQYDSKRYFTSKLSEAFQRRGIKTRIFDQKLFPVWNPSLGELPDFTCSFHRLILQESPQSSLEGGAIPHLSLLVDPLFYYKDVLKMKGSLCSCVDRSECQSMRSQGYENVFFLPHAVEKDLVLDENRERPYDVAFIGSSYDPEALREIWKAKLPLPCCRALEDAAERVFAEPSTTFVEAMKLSLHERSIEASGYEFFYLANLLDCYTRGVDRVELVRSIKDAHVHLFGGVNPRREMPIRGWGEYFFDCENVTVHPAVNYAESLQVLMRSKIALNSMPFFKDGSHERVFNALACGAVPVTSESGYLQETFKNGEHVFFYPYKDRAQVNALVHDCLGNDKLRKDMALQGRAKVLAEHTWDNRVDAILSELSQWHASMERLPP